MQFLRCNVSIVLGLFLVVATTLGAQSSSVAPPPDGGLIHSGVPWFDTAGHRINAHGGGVYFFNDRYYWYGENKIAGKGETNDAEHNMADGGIHAYSSDDLVHWRDEGVVFSVDYEHTGRDTSYGCILERPKVVYDAAGRQYVAFFKLYPPGTGYQRGYVGKATAGSPVGPFVYQGKSRGGNAEYGTGDFALFEDADGSRYHLGVRKPDRAFVAGKLVDGGTAIAPAANYHALEGVINATEAPAVLLRDGKYYLFGSGSTGFASNPARSFVASSIYGPYRNLGNFTRGVNPHNGLGPEKTFGGQISFVIPVHGKPGAYIAMFDVWNPEENAAAVYIWLPLAFEEGKPIVRWIDAWSPLVYFGESKASAMR